MEGAHNLPIYLTNLQINGKCQENSNSHHMNSQLLSGYILPIKLSCLFHWKNVVMLFLKWTGKLKRAEKLINLIVYTIYLQYIRNAPGAHKIIVKKGILKF